MNKEKNKNNKQLIKARGDHIETVNNAFGQYQKELITIDKTYEHDITHAENKRNAAVNKSYEKYRAIKDTASRKFQKIRKELGEPL